MRNTSLSLLHCLQASVAATALIAPVAAHAAEPGATIVEFFNSTSSKYFISANPADWALLDQYASIGWKRTGVTFSAFTQGQDASAKPVYRFYAPAVGSHFFTISESDRALLANTPGFVAEGVAWYAYDQLQTLVATINPCASGTTALYRTFNNGSNGPANHRYFQDYGFYQSYAAKGYALEGVAMCLPLSTAEKRADASRLLYQASFGAKPSDIDAVLNRGASGWIDDQLNAAASQYTPRDWWPLNRPDTCVNNTTPPLTDASYCQRDNYSLFQPQREFFKQAINNNDQLRQRMAWAWSQFFVISGTDVGMPYGMIDYQQMLRDEAFSNFRALLQKVTLHAAMGLGRVAVNEALLLAVHAELNRLTWQRLPLQLQAGEFGLRLAVHCEAGRVIESLAGAAQVGRHALVAVHHHAVVNENDAFAGGVGKLAQAFLAVAQRLFRGTVPADVVD